MVITEDFSELSNDSECILRYFYVKFEVTTPHDVMEEKFVIKIGAKMDGLIFYFEEKAHSL